MLKTSVCLPSSSWPPHSALLAHLLNIPEAPLFIEKIPLGGIIALYISGGLLKWGGGLIGGKAESDEVRAAIAWSSLVRSIAILLMYCVQLPLLGQETFMQATPILDARLASDPVYAIIASVIFIIVLTLAIVLGIWYAVVFLKCLGEAHQFSTWKALLASIIGYGVIIVPVVLLALLSGYFMSR